MGIEGHPMDIERLFFVTATSLIIFLIGIGLLPTSARGIQSGNEGLGPRAHLIAYCPDRTFAEGACAPRGALLDKARPQPP